MLPRSLAVALLALLALSGGALAQASVDGRMDHFDAPASSIQRDINSLYYLIFPMSIVIGILVEVLLIYAIIRFRAKPGKVEVTQEHERGHTKLEIAWTIPPAVILLAVGLLSTQTLTAIENPPGVGASLNDAACPSPNPQAYFCVDVVASQFSFGFLYPGQTKAGGLANKLEVEEDRVVILNVTSTDVIHSFSVPALGAKIDAVPGRLNRYWIRGDDPGTFQVQCMEYCGVSHAYMRTAVVILPAGSTPNGWVEQAGPVDLSVVDRALNLNFPERAGGGKTWSADPPSVTVPQGQSIGVAFTNPSSNAVGHNITVLSSSGAVVGKIDNIIQPGGKAEMYLQPAGSPDPAAGEEPAALPAGTYAYFCAVPGHRALGMEGQLTVS